MLKIQQINAFYGDMQALWGASLEVRVGELVALVGPNGAGKTTLLRAITGLLKPAQGDVCFLDQVITTLPVHQRVGRGMSLVPESGRIFTRMSVQENLELGAFDPKARKQSTESLQWIFSIFPRLEERKKQQAGTLSGGERQMLAIGRALMSKPLLLMLDEPSFGLAPIMVEQMFDMIQEINRLGVTVLLVEQNVRAALELANRAYVIENGRVVGEGKEKELLSFESIRTAYLGC